MKLLVVSDLHPDVVTFGVPRYPEVESAVDQSVEAAEKYDVDVYVMLGDLADPDQGAATLRAVLMLQRAAMKIAIAKRKRIFIAVAGNHDVSEDGSGVTTLTPLRALEQFFPERIFIAEQPRLIPLPGDYAFLALPYTARSHASDIATMAANLWPRTKKVIVGAHLMIDGVTPGEETTEMPRGREIAFPIAETRGAAIRMNGHYHTRQVTKEGIVIPGSIARLTAGEHKNEPSFLVVEV